VQEALTNVRKHAGAVPTRVTLRRERSELVIEVENDGPVVAAAAPGNGLTGMRERVTALGGTLLAGPRPAGGFRVTARLPA
jgi:signal transduction histidine kinase